MTQKSRIHQISWFLTLIIFVSIFSFTNCSKKESLEFNEGFKAYIYAYTSGVISRSSPIRLRFTQALVDETVIGNEVEKGILTFEPNIKGRAIWEDDRTIKFVADEYLPSGEPYFGRVAVKNLYDNVPKDLRTFLFDFTTKEQFFEVEIEGMRAVSETDLTKQKVVGTLITADVADNESVEKILSATQKGNEALSITWQHDADLLHHHFVIDEVNRGEKASEVKLKWEGKNIGVSKKGSANAVIPALGDFKVSDVSIVQKEAEQYILAEFSDPISKMQDVEGLIAVSGYSGALNYVIDKNTIRIYPASRMAGDRTITVSRGIKNVMDKPMKSPSDWQVTFAEIKPQVKLVGNGVILPNTDKGLIFPFDAVSLNAIDVEIFKIYENNVLQFLQTNDLDGDYNLERVGRVVMQKKIPLNQLNSRADFSLWTRYALDLNDLIKREPNAIYQVRIGFQQSYSTYFCSGEEPEGADGMTILASQNNINEEGEIKSFWDANYGYYKWEERENPCHEAYYKSYYRRQRFAKANVIASDMGLVAKRGSDGSYFVAVNDLISAKPISDVAIKFYDYQQQLIKETKSNVDGIVNSKMDKKPYFVVAQNGSQRGYLKLQDGHALSLSRYDVGGERSYKGIKGFLYGERGVWRPGDSLFLSFILEDKFNNLPAAHPVSFELFDARGQLQQTIVKTDNVNHVYDFSTVTSPDAPTGVWRAKIKVGGAEFQKRLRIETVKPNRLKIKLDFGKEELVAGDNLEGKLQVNWLHGAIAKDIRTEVKVQLRTVNTEFKNYGDYEFDDPARSFSGTAQTIFDKPTDENGAATVTSKINTNDAAPGKMKANFSIRAYEKSGDFSSDNFSLPYNPYDGYVGISLPKKRSGEKRFDMNKNYKINVVSLSANGKARSNKKLSVGLYRVNWRWWWDSGSDNITNYSTSTHYGAKKKDVITTASNGKADWNVKVDDWGRYMIRVCDEETGHCTGDIFYAGYPWNEDNTMAKQAAAMLTFSSDKTKYNVGETVELKVPLSESGSALITIENGTKVIESYWRTAQKGDNTFAFNVTKEMAPNVYAHVTLVQPHAQVENDLPIRMYGILPIMVEDPKTRLEPQIAMKDELAPEETFTVKVSEKNGKPMAYTLAIVDEGLLDLTRFKTPDPWNHFYAKEALGVKTWDMYDYVMGANTGEIKRILSIGGDDALGPREGQKANRFKPVVRFVGPFYTNGRTKSHEITMPNYVGSVRVMVVASDADKNAYGNAEKTVPVKKPLMVLGTLPRVLSPGETVKLPVTVFAMEDNIRNVSVRLQTNGLLDVQGSSTKNLKFSRAEDKIATFEIQVPKKVGIARVKIIAISGNEKATQDIELDVRNPNPYITDVYEAVVEKGKTWTQGFEPVGMEGTNSAILEVSNIPPMNLGERLQYLIRYPHGCIEQTTSSGFPQLYVNKLIDLDKEQKTKVDDNIRATIDRLKKFQTASGGFAYWPGNVEASTWGTTYGGHFMIEAQKIGFTLPPSMLSQWKKYQRKIAKTWVGSTDYHNTDLDQAYRLYTLALADAPEWGAMNRLKEKANLSDAARWRLAAAYAISGKKSVATTLTKNLNYNIKPYRELGYTYGSNLRDQAMILETLTAIGDKIKSAKLLKIIAKDLNNDKWYSTQTTAYCLLAIGKYVGANDVSKKFTFTYTLAGNSKNMGSKNPIVQVNFNPETASDVKMKNTSDGMLFVRIIAQGKPDIGEETNGENNLKLAIQYKDLNGKAIDQTNIKQGSDFIAEVTISNPGEMGNYQEMALTQIFPSGWEIHNTRMDNISTYSKTNVPEYQDIRDDRVYSYFDIGSGKTQVYRIQLNAAYQGRYYLPAVSASAMYDNTISARQAGNWVNVVGQGLEN